jgi:hypothetical protein
VVVCENKRKKIDQGAFFGEYIDKAKRYPVLKKLTQNIQNQIFTNENATEPQEYYYQENIVQPIDFNENYYRKYSGIYHVDFSLFDLYSKQTPDIGIHRIACIISSMNINDYYPNIFEDIVRLVINKPYERHILIEERMPLMKFCGFMNHSEILDPLLEKLEVDEQNCLDKNMLSTAVGPDVAGSFTPFVVCGDLYGAKVSIDNKLKEICLDRIEGYEPENIGSIYEWEGDGLLPAFMNANFAWEKVGTIYTIHNTKLNQILAVKVETYQWVN